MEMRIRRGNLSTDKLENRSIHIYTPPTYHKDNSVAFPAVIVQDGDYLFTGSMEELEVDFASGTTQEVLFIGIEPNRRDCEYTPWEAELEVFGGEGETYLELYRCMLLFKSQTTLDDSS
ncbi:hypothetical protein [Paenibacillus sp. 453mf]|uniref:hypothetical protein n=1 Tax=Paenibacillus sp. 453mf TaxID=1761874 RepID=UPI0008EC7E13|nr:hypothetical protein [Paenibacillus sp. 453mf]SFS56062.1 hypothetical protein SAMN04488601_1011718 [Paenibacillus sp. 453mf]